MLRWVSLGLYGSVLVMSAWLVPISRAADVDEASSSTSASARRPLKCERVGERADKCAFVLEACQDVPNAIDYLRFVYCAPLRERSSATHPTTGGGALQEDPSTIGFRERAAWVEVFGMGVLCAWLGVLLSMLGTTADVFFVEQLEFMSRRFRLADDVAGATLMAFGNGAPDVFTAWNAIENASDFGLVLAELLGAAMFVTTVVLGAVILTSPARAACRVDPLPFARDAATLALSVFAIAACVLDGRIQLVESLAVVCLYAAYLTLVVATRPQSSSSGSSSSSGLSGVSAAAAASTSSRAQAAGRRLLVISPDRVASSSSFSLCRSDDDDDDDDDDLGGGDDDDDEDDVEAGFKNSPLGGAPGSVGSGSSASAARPQHHKQRKQPGGGDDEPLVMTRSHSSDSGGGYYAAVAQSASAENGQHRESSYQGGGGRAPDEADDAALLRRDDDDDEENNIALGRHHHRTRGTACALCSGGGPHRCGSFWTTPRGGGRRNRQDGQNRPDGADVGRSRKTTARSGFLFFSGGGGGGSCGFCAASRRGNAVGGVSSKREDRGLGVVHYHRGDRQASSTTPTTTITPPPTLSLRGVHWSSTTSSCSKLIHVIEWPFSVARHLSIPSATFEPQWGPHRRRVAALSLISATLVIAVDVVDDPARALARNVFAEWTTTTSSTDATDDDDSSSSSRRHHFVPFVPLGALVVSVGVALAALAMATTRDDEPPSLGVKTALVVAGFLAAVAWLDLLASETVAVLESLGAASGLSSAVLGCTLLAWGNCIGDLVADTAVAKANTKAAIASVFNSPLFSQILSLGAPVAYYTYRRGALPIHIDQEAVLSFAGVAVSLATTTVVCARHGYVLPRSYAFALFAMYALYVILSLLVSLRSRAGPTS